MSKHLSLLAEKLLSRDNLSHLVKLFILIYLLNVKEADYTIHNTN